MGPGRMARSQAGLDAESGPDSPEETESELDSPLGPKWKNRLPLAILTLAPSAYLAIRIYVRTGGCFALLWCTVAAVTRY